ncbi:MAG: hypothetical protein R2736_06405 [Solirubrobacterales bacterium]
MVALDVSWTWVVILVGVVLGALLAFAAIAADLPMVLLIVLSALGGASDHRPGSCCWWAPSTPTSSVTAP